MQRKLFVIIALVAAACGGPQQGAEPESIPLGQARAIEVVEGAAGGRGVGSTESNVAATLSNGTEVNVDVLIRTLGAGYVWMNEQDRRDYGPVPERSEGSELHAVLGQLAGGGQVHVLVLQDMDYAYLPNPRADERRPDEVTIDYVEARLRRDSLDFIQAIVDLRGGTE